MREISAFDANDRLGQLLDSVEAGEEIVITRGGKAVARLIPSQGIADPSKARRAADAIRAMSKGVTLGGLTTKELIGEGRR